MDYNRLINFLINNKLLSENVFFTKQFIVTRRFHSNITYAVKIPETEQVSLFIKIKRNQNNVNGKLLLREFVLYNHFKDDNSFPFGFSKFPTIGGNGIYQNNSIFIREFIVDYTSSDRLLLSAIMEKKSFIENIAKKLYTFHEYSKKTQLSKIRKSFKKVFNESELSKNPLIISEIQPLNKFKFAPFFIQEFWRILNHTNTKPLLNKIIKSVFRNWKTNRIVHGDFRLANILFEDLNNEINLDKYLFIDFELWHFGDYKWDIICFIYDLEIFIKKNNVKLQFDLIDTFVSNYCTNNSENDIIRNALILLKLQNLYFELNEENFKEQLDAIKNILNSIKKA